MLRLTPLHSRFGRRLLLLFAGCALVPIVLLAILSYRHVPDSSDSRAKSGSTRPIRRSAWRFSSAFSSSMQRFGAYLRRRSRSSAPACRRTPRPQTPSPNARELEGSRMLAAGLDLVIGRRFQALEFVTDGGARVPVFGQLESDPLAGSSHAEDLAVGLPVLISEPAGEGRSRIFLLRRVDRLGGVQGTLVGEASPEFLWGTLDQSMPSATTMVSVVDDSGRMLFSSTAGAPVSSDTVPADEAFLASLARPTADSVDRHARRPRAVCLLDVAAGARRSLRRDELAAPVEPVEIRSPGPHGAVYTDVPRCRGGLLPPGAGAEHSSDQARPGAVEGAPGGNPPHRSTGLWKQGDGRQPRRVRGARRLVQRDGGGAGPSVPRARHRGGDRSRRALVDRSPRASSRRWWRGRGTSIPATWSA